MTTEDTAVDVSTTPAAPLPNEGVTPAEAEAPKADAEAPTEKPDGEQSQADKEAQDASEAGKKLAERKRSAQERISQITREKHEALREAERLKARLAQYEQYQRPDPAQFTDQDEFDQQQAAYQAAQLRKSEIAFEKTDQEARALKASVEAFNERAEDFAKEVPTFKPDALADVIYGQPNAQILAREVLDSEYGPQLAHYLAQRPNDAMRIASMDPRQMVRELTKLEISFANPPPKKVTQAPTPIKAVSGSSTASKSVDPDRMSFADFKKFREAGGKI